MKKRNKALATVEDVAQAVGDVIAVPIDVGGDLIDDITPELGEIADAAVSTVAATGRVGVRLATRTVRFIARRPKEVMIGLVVVATALAVLSYLKSRSDGAAVTANR